MILISGPGHGGNFFVANTYLEGTYSEVYPNIGEDMDGLKKLCKQFSFPGGISKPRVLRRLRDPSTRAVSLDTPWLTHSEQYLTIRI